jgi:hypothetical protein
LYERCGVSERVPASTLFLGGPTPLLDVLFDTTDSEPNMRAFCHVAYDPAFPSLVAHLGTSIGVDLGVAITAF